jgi:stage II sporulation protein P
MNTIGSEDSNDDSDITAVPSDIAKLMKNAKKTVSEENSVGKTSEEAYQGGGTIISYDDLEIQSKIPSSFYEPDIKALLKQGSDLKISDKSKPTILVYHSHTTEAYSLLDVGYYMKSDSRSNDNEQNMVRVGDELVKYLELAGFNVIHDTEIHDTDYNSSYDSSREVVEKYLEEYPSIEVTIDVHRDDITYKNKTKVKPTAVINGKKAARMMIIAGCEYGRVVNFPDWEYNLRFDLAVQNKVNEMYSGLMRPILFSERKYNMYETHNSFLLEIGTDANTLDEACYSARLFGKALGELLNDYVS